MIYGAFDLFIYFFDAIIDKIVFLIFILGLFIASMWIIDTTDFWIAIIYPTAFLNELALMIFLVWIS